MAKLQFKSVWVASVANIDFPKKPGQPADELKVQLDDIVMTAKKAGLNQIFFQVRPCSDALYKSNIFPTSSYLVSKQGDPLPGGFDPLAYIIKASHEKGIELHAWINPYRVTQGSEMKPRYNLNDLAPNNPARLHPEYVIPYADGKLYYNPAMPEVRKLIVEGIAEIVSNYDVDGIHFDDYFYPYPIKKEVGGVMTPVPYDDGYQYSLYGNGKDREDWRRENVNILIKEVYDVIKAMDSKLKFGISPFAIWRNKSSDPAGSDTNGFESYSQLYCDSVAWIKGQYIDYICPQIYWPTDHPTAPFKPVLDWWDDVVDGTSVDLYVGHGLYKIETWSAKDELLTQLRMDEASKHGIAAVFFGYDKIKAEIGNCSAIIAKY